MQEGATIQELPVSSSASPAVSEAKHVPSKPIKHEGGKAESGGGGVSNIPADALNRLIAMGGPAGRLLPACHVIFSAMNLFQLWPSCLPYHTSVLAGILLCTDKL